jgi:cyclopropane-fatty-acyl-phospholipid synthase
MSELATRPATGNRRLLAHADRGLLATVSHAIGDAPASLGRAVIVGLLRRLRNEQLTVHESIRDRPATTVTYGRAGTLQAHVTVSDRRAYTAVATEGSIGLGRGYLEGWWSSDDPVAVVQVLIRNMGTIDAARNRWQRAVGPITDRIRVALPRDTRARNRDDIAAHYDIGNEFFASFLDETMTYSSAIFADLDAASTTAGPDADTLLADASRHKCDVLLRRLGVERDHHLAEIGTGWGAMAIRAASTTGCRVTTTTISAEQHAEAGRRVDAAGLADRVGVIDADWRDLPDRLGADGAGRADRLVSVEMIEAVDWRDYDHFFASIERCLAPGGRAAIQAIVLPDDRWERAKNTEDFIRRFVFPNGYLPSVAAIRASVARATAMRVVAVEHYAPHYAETLRLWRERFDARLDADPELARELGLDERFRRLWRFYLAYCESGFRERHCDVVHIVIER